MGCWVIALWWSEATLKLNLIFSHQIIRSRRFIYATLIILHLDKVDNCLTRVREFYSRLCPIVYLKDQKYNLSIIIQLDLWILCVVITQWLMLTKFSERLFMCDYWFLHQFYKMWTLLYNFESKNASYFASFFRSETNLADLHIISPIIQYLADNCSEVLKDDGKFNFIYFLKT